MVGKEPPVKETDQIEEKKNVELSVEEAFTKLYPEIVRFFKRRGFSRERARELAQDVFVSVYKGWDGFRDEARRETWIWKIAKNLLMNEWRRLTALKRDVDVVPLPEHESAEISRPAKADDRVLEDERKLLLREAIKDLAPRMRQCVLLQLKGLTNAGIAKTLKVSKNTVKSQLFDARRKLHEKLAAHFPELLERLKEGDETDA